MKKITLELTEEELNFISIGLLNEKKAINRRYANAYKKDDKDSMKFYRKKSIEMENLIQRVVDLILI